MTLSSSGSASSDLFEPDDPEFLKALSEAILPGDIIPDATSNPTLKRALDKESEDEENTYGPSRFGEMDEYMNRKRAKLQIQNDTIDGASSIFEGIAVYINGWTEPSIQELRGLILCHGGKFHAYLDKKSLVTHIITCSLTPAKMREFKHMKVARPAWILESVSAGTLLPWSNYAFRPEASTKQIPIAQQLLPVAPSPKPSDLTPESHSSPEPEIPPSTQPRARPKYAAHDSNPLAARAMARPAWRETHTAAAPDFLTGYHRASRLHHLSTWKAELRVLVAEAHARVERGEVVSKQALNAEPDKGKGKEKAVDPNEKVERVVMHCDFDCFFVSAGLVSRPELRGKPVVVCHAQGSGGGSTSEVASASYEARAFGVRNGMSLQQSRALCPDVITMPYEFDRYKKISLQFYTILMSHADELEAVSVDEALIEVHMRLQDARVLADTIRTQVRGATSCEVSIGMGPNILLARLATRLAKPAGVHHFQSASSSSARTALAALDVGALHGFGDAARTRVQEKLEVVTLGALAGRSKRELVRALGPSRGARLFDAIKGVDDRQLVPDKPRKSVSCEVNYGIRFADNNEAGAFVKEMGVELMRRLDALGVRAHALTLKLMVRSPGAPIEPPKFMGHGECDTISRQTNLTEADMDADSLGECAWRICQSLSLDPKELRGVGMQAHKLDPVSASTTKATTIDGARAKLQFLPQQQIVHAKASSSKIPLTPVRGVDPLPSFSQVDRSVFDALPEDVRQELEQAYKRESASPAPVAGSSKVPIAGPSKPAPIAGSSKVLSDMGPPNLPPPRTKFTSRESTSDMGPPLWPAPRSDAGKKRSVYSFLAPRPRLKKTVHPDELRELDIDPDVFAALPERVQHEQIGLARALRAPGGPNVFVPHTRIPLKPSSPVPLGPRPPRIPPPQARYPVVPVLKKRTRNEQNDKEEAMADEEQSGKIKPERTKVVELATVDEVQGAIEAWVEGLRVQDSPPDSRDVAFFGRWAVKSVEAGYSGMERAVAVLKWWMVLLRRYWSTEENYKEDEMEDEDGKTGRAWWAALREIKSQMDAIARKRFGGCLSLR